MGFTSQDISGLSNQHIWEFLRYYLGLTSSPRYAVYIDGPWGVGKSHLVQRIIDDHFRGWKDDYVKISLFGLSTINEIDETLFSAIYPMLNSPGAHIVGGLMKAGLSYVSASTEVRLQKLLSNKKASVYIFDDLERCELELPKVLGYINTFVEHGAKVIVIGDQARLEVTQDTESLERYNKEREKLVGRTLQVDPSFDEAWESFIRCLETEEGRSFLTNKLDHIRATFEQSETKNLRLLKLTLLDFERVLPALKVEHITNDEAMTTFLSLFFAVSFEVKRGKLSEEDVMQRDDVRSIALRRHLTKGAATDLAPIEVSQKQYSLVDICDPLLPSSVFVDLLFRGTIPAEDIRAALDRSRFFAQITHQPVWLRLVHVMDLTEEEFSECFAQMERMFERREIIVIGEMLHVFSHRLWLSRHNFVPTPLQEVARQCIAYVDNLYTEGKLQDDEPDRSFRLTGYAGYSFAERDEAEFRDIANHLMAQLAQAERDRYPQKALALLDELEHDPELFARRIHLTNSQDNLYWNVPVLAEACPHEFVLRLLRQSPSYQNTILRALLARYESHHIRNNELRSELPWLENMRLHLIEESSRLQMFSARRINLMVTRSIDPVLNEAPVQPN